VDTNLYDDYVPHYVDRNTLAQGAMGFSPNFFSFPEYVLGSAPTCLAQMRNYAYIYVPRGWHSFGLVVNSMTADTLLLLSG